MSPSISPFSDDVSLFILEDIGIVFSETAQKIYELNTMATWIWCQLEDGLLVDQLPTGLADTFGIAEDTAERHLSEALEAWRDLGFLTKTSAKTRPTFPEATSPGRTPQGRLPRNILLGLRQGLSGGERQIKTYRNLGQDTIVVYPTEDLMALVHPAVAHVVQPRRILTPQSLVEILPQGTGFDIKRDGAIKYRNIARDQLTPVIQYLVFLAGIEQSAYAVAFHAGAVALDDRVAVLPGSAGSGKTSLTAALLSQGFRYLSDDLLLMGTDLKIEGVPFALCIKDTGVTPLAPYYPDLPSLTLHHRPDGKNVRYLSAPLTSSTARPAAPRLPASWVIFPKYRAGGTTKLKPLGKGEALRRLMESSTLALPLTRAQIETFIRWLEALSCYDLEVNSLPEAVSVVENVMKQ